MNSLLGANATPHTAQAFDKCQALLECKSRRHLKSNNRTGED